MKKKSLNLLLLFALGLILVTAASVFLLYSYDKQTFFILLIPVSILIVTFTVLLITVRHNIYKFVAKLERNVNTATSSALYHYPSYAAIVDKDGKLLWYNNKFEDVLLGGANAFGETVESVIGIGTPAHLDEIINVRGAKGMTFAFSGRYYRMTAGYANKVSSDFYIVSITDITDLAALQNKYKLTRPYVLLIMIDNYDDLLLGAKDSERAEISVAIEHLLEELISQTTGVLRKLGNDRFIAVIEEQHLRHIINERFKILDKAREIILGRTNITLSIGVGCGADSLVESEAFAKQSLDMALGRGGDQAVVKSEAGFKFYGGISKAVEKKSKSKTRIIAKAMKELIQNSRQVFIMGHCFGDFDSIGSAIGLAGAINSMDCDAYVVFDSEKNLAAPLIESFSETESDEIFLSVEEAEESWTDDSLLIIVDTHNRDFVESKTLYEKAENLVIIDHHRKTVNFIDNAAIFHHEPSASSTSEMVTEVIQYFFDNITLPPAYAEALLAGITLDTKNFVMKTGVRTFEAAALLRKTGADPVSVKKLFASSFETFNIKAQFISNTEVYNRCAVVTCELESSDIRTAAPQAADDLLGIRDVDASFVIFKSNNCINISARSLGAVNVQLIMEELGGGGHLTMAAAQLYDKTIDEAKEILMKQLASGDDDNNE